LINSQRTLPVNTGNRHLILLSAYKVLIPGLGSSFGITSKQSSENNPALIL
jgi:hypothetical protein